MENGDDDDDLDFFLLVKNLTGRNCSRFLDKSPHYRWHDNSSRSCSPRHRKSASSSHHRHSSSSSHRRCYDGDTGKCPYCEQPAHVTGQDMVGSSRHLSDGISRQNPKSSRSSSLALTSDALSRAGSGSLGSADAESNDVSRYVQVGSDFRVSSDVVPKDGSSTPSRSDVLPEERIISPDISIEDLSRVQSSSGVMIPDSSGVVRNEEYSLVAVEKGDAVQKKNKHDSWSHALETGLEKGNAAQNEEHHHSRSDVLVKDQKSVHFTSNEIGILAMKDEEARSILDDMQHGGDLICGTSDSPRKDSDGIPSNSVAHPKGNKGSQSISCSVHEAFCNVQQHNDNDLVVTFGQGKPFKGNGNLSLKDDSQTQKSNDDGIVSRSHWTPCKVDVSLSLENQKGAYVREGQIEEAESMLGNQCEIEDISNSVEEGKPVASVHVTLYEALPSTHVNMQGNFESIRHQTVSLSGAFNSCLSGNKKKRSRLSAIRDLPEGCCKSPKLSTSTQSSTSQSQDEKHLPVSQKESLYSSTEDGCSSSYKLSAEIIMTPNSVKHDFNSCKESLCEVYIPERSLDHGKFSVNNLPFIDLTEDDDEDLMEISNARETIFESAPSTGEGKNASWELVPRIPVSSFPQEEHSHKIDWIVESEEISPELVDLAVQPKDSASKDNVQSIAPLQSIPIETNRNAKDHLKPSCHIARSKICQPSTADFTSSNYITNEPYPDSVDGISARSLVKRILHQFESLRKFIAKSNINIRRADLEAASKLKDKWQNNEEKIIGDVPGVEVGDQFSFRIEMVIIGLHRQVQGGIDYIPGSRRSSGSPIATSIVASGGYEDDVDGGDILIYSGQGGNNYKGDKRQKSDQRLERGNLALSNSMKEKTPVRVIRGMFDTNSSTKLYTYDGLYDVVDERFDRGAAGFGVFTFKLVRRPGQPQVGLSIVKFVGSLKRRGLVRPHLLLEDISQGQERIPICVVNEVDAEQAPIHFHYIPNVLYSSWFSRVKPQGCDCVGDCSDESKCRCALKNGGEFPYNEKGYIIQDKKVIYECGSSCRCSSSCPNRVTQNGLRYQLEIFKTKNRGWGVRSLNSIQPGGFICEYVGELLSDAEAEKRVNNDEYLFDLGNHCDPSSVGSTNGEPLDEDISYTIDAKALGNVARFINHSCSPNLFAQNVLYDSDDMRFPHVMLFAMENIPPMRELTYDYNYSIDEVCDAHGNIKKKACYCGASDCRGRLY